MCEIVKFNPDLFFVATVDRTRVPVSSFDDGSGGARLLFVEMLKENQPVLTQHDQSYIQRREHPASQLVCRPLGLQPHPSDREFLPLIDYVSCQFARDRSAYCCCREGRLPAAPERRDSRRFCFAACMSAGLQQAAFSSNVMSAYFSLLSNSRRRRTCIMTLSIKRPISSRRSAYFAASNAAPSYIFGSR